MTTVLFQTSLAVHVADLDAMSGGWEGPVPEVDDLVTFEHVRPDGSRHEYPMRVLARVWTRTQEEGTRVHLGVWCPEPRYAAAEWETWYRKEIVGDVPACPGSPSGHRFRS